MRIRSAVEIEDPAAEAEPSSRERRIKAGYRRLLRAVLHGKREPERPKAKGSRLKEGRDTESRRPGAVDYLSRFLCAWFALALLVSGCAGPKALKGGHAATTHKPGGGIEQTLAQGESASQSTRQDQEILIATNFGACCLAGLAGHARR